MCKIKTGEANLLDEVTFGAECFANLWMAALHGGARSLWARGGWLPLTVFTDGLYSAFDTLSM